MNPVALLLWLLVFASAIGTSDSERRKYEIQPVALSGFDESREFTPCDPLPTSDGNRPVARLVAVGSGLALHRKDELSIPSNEASRLILRPQATEVSISAEPRNEYSVELCAAAGKLNGPDAKAVIDSIHLNRAGDTLAVTAPTYDPERPSRATLRIRSPQDLPINVDGSFSAVEISGASAPVNIKTTHARVKITQTSGTVEAEASEFGVIDFAGDRGNVRLTSAAEINLELTSKTFEGSLYARAERPVRIALPDGFVTPFEVQVRKDDDFVCRAAFCNQVKRSSQSAVQTFRFGSKSPQLQFISNSGPVVIDSVEALRATDERRLREAKERGAELMRQTRHINELADSIHSETDARAFVEALWEVFAHDAPKWIARPMLNRVAHAEYMAVTHRALIPDQGIAESFNTFAQQIGAPDWARVTGEELHRLRAGELASAKAFRAMDAPNIWALPNLYAVDASGHIDSGCRAIEAMKMLYTLNEMFANVVYQRELIRRGITTPNSEQPKEVRITQEQMMQSQAALAQGEEQQAELRRTQLNYIKQHGDKAYEQLVRQMFERVLS